MHNVLASKNNINDLRFQVRIEKNFYHIVKVLIRQISSQKDEYSLYSLRYQIISFDFTKTQNAIFTKTYPSFEGEISKDL